MPMKVVDDAEEEEEDEALAGFAAKTLETQGSIESKTNDSPISDQIESKVDEDATVGQEEEEDLFKLISEETTYENFEIILV